MRMKRGRGEGEKGRGTLRARERSPYSLRGKLVKREYLSGREVAGRVSKKS